MVWMARKIKKVNFDRPVKMDKMFKWVKCAPNAPKIVKGVHQDSLIPKVIIFHDSVGLEINSSSST